MVTVLTRTIGPSGRDYASFTLAEADVTNIGTSADLVANDEAIVFEADAGTYSEYVTFLSTLTQDATRNVTYKPAAGSEHGGSKSSGVIVTSSATTFLVQDDHTQFDGLVIASNGFYCVNNNADGTGYRDCIMDGSAGTSFGVFFMTGGSASAPIVAENCVAFTTTSILFYTRGIVDSNIRLVNCTAISSGNGLGFRLEGSTLQLDVEFINCLSLAQRSYAASGTYTASGSNNFGGSSNPFPAAIQGSPYPITATTSFSTPLGSGDYAVYMGATGALADVTGNDVWQQGVGPASNSDVPTTDINGVTRSGATCNPGAFEADGFVAPTVLTRTIGSGKDYSTFTLAEAAVTSIGSGTDLTFYNEAIVFEADAGTYSENVTFSSGLTTDATRQVTYRPASGSEHGGLLGAGVLLEGSSNQLAFDDFQVFRGIEVKRSGSTSNCWDLNAAVVFDSCILGAVVHRPGTTTTTDRTAFRNCVFTDCGTAITIFNYGDSYVDVANCTLLNNQSLGFCRFIQLGATSGNTCEVTLTNVLSFSTNAYSVSSSAGTVTVTGAGCFYGLYDPFPSGVLGTPNPITPTTNTSPGAGDWAIYQASNGQLYNIVANDVWQQGVGPTANSDVPATDILGYARYGATANPGAFELGLPVPGIRVKPRHFQVNTAATAHAVSVWQPQLRKL